MSLQKRIGDFDNEKLFPELHLLKMTWSQTRCFSYYEQIVELETSCPTFFVILPVFSSSWKSVSNLRTISVVLYSFKLKALNSGLGTNELPWYELSDTPAAWIMNVNANSNNKLSKVVQPRAAKWTRRLEGAEEMLHEAHECYKQIAPALSYLWPLSYCGSMVGM